MDNEYEKCYRYEQLFYLCREYNIGHEKHEINERLNFDLEYITLRVDCVAKRNLCEMKFIFRKYNVEISKSNKKTIGGQNQYLISYDYKID